MTLFSFFSQEQITRLIANHSGNVQWENIRLFFVTQNTLNLISFIFSVFGMSLNLIGDCLPYLCVFLYFFGLRVS